MQQGHPRHKQLIRARHEMAMHRRYMFAKKINEVMHSFETKPPEEKPEIKDIYSEMHNPKGLIQIVPPEI